MKRAAEILDAAVREYDPAKVFALFSGGTDSVCALHVAMQHPRFSGAAFVNTGTGIPDTLTYIRETTAALGVPLLEYAAAEGEYERQVLKVGFPGPAQHFIMYRVLKERAIRRLVADHKRHRGDRVLLVTGARAQESVRRMGTTQEVRRVGSQVWVNPIIDWSHDDKWAYIEEHKLPLSPVWANLHMSGECLCGAYAKPGEKDVLRFFYPDVVKRIDDLERRVFQKHPRRCRWGETPGEEIPEGQAWLPLCQSCPTRWDEAAA